MKSIIMTTILVFAVVILETTIPNGSMVVGSSEWLDGVKECVMVFHENNSTDEYYDCMQENDVNIMSDDENNDG